MTSTSDSGYKTGVIIHHPYKGVWLGDIGALWSVPDGVDAVVSRCRVGDADLPDHSEQIDVRLIDRPHANVNLDFVLLDTVHAVEQLRRDDRTVLIHCVQAQSRTPTVATLYGARLRGIRVTEALADVCVVLPDADPIPEFCRPCNGFIRSRTENPDDYRTKPNDLGLTAHYRHLPRSG